MFVRPAGNRIFRRTGDNIGRRALEHGNLRGGASHRRHQRYRRRTAADHDHALVGIIQIFRPLLRMDDLAPETLRALEMRRVAACVIVIAAAHIEERAGDMARLAILLDLQRPLSVFGGPARRHHLATEANMPVDSEFLRGVDDITADRLAIGDGAIARPGVEGKAQRIHVRIRTDARIAEQIPGAADRIARFEDRVALAGAFGGNAVARIDTGKPSAHDQDIETLRDVGRRRGLTCFGGTGHFSVPSARGSRIAPIWK